MIYRILVEVTGNFQLTDDIFDIRFKDADIAKSAVPGQFINLYPNDKAHLLPRPISICEVNGDEIRLVYRVVGAGTDEFSRMRQGDRLYVTGPVGNGYDTESFNRNFKEAVLFGGGAGIPPMIELSKRLKIKTSVFVGYRDVLFLHEDFPSNVDVYIATEDGSRGSKGNVLDALKDSGIRGDLICACGPMPMLRAIKKYSEANQIKTFFSLEERMACGIGACLGCVCRTKKVDAHSHVHNARVCVDGPVYDAEEVEI